jgi:hypothetical protein
LPDLSIYIKESEKKPLKPLGIKNNTEEKYTGEAELTFQEWRKLALPNLNLEEIYGSYLTGKEKGAYYECRDPERV